MQGSFIRKARCRVWLLLSLVALLLVDAGCAHQARRPRLMHGHARSLAIPKGSKACPLLVPGDNWISVPGLQTPRIVRVWLNPRRQRAGALIMYWHGTASDPSQAKLALGAQFDRFVEDGGVVVAPHKHPQAGLFPWFLVTGRRSDDLMLADQVVACLHAQRRIDTRRIHMLGMSAGGIHTAYLSQLRKRYVASSATFSGGFLPQHSFPQEQGTPPPTLVFHGGWRDFMLLSFRSTSERYVREMRSSGGSTVVCRHDEGHRIPKGAAQLVLDFFRAHPFHLRHKRLPLQLPGGCRDASV